MSHSFRVALSFLGLCVLAVGQSSSTSGGVDLKAIDKSVDPCKDFFHYACGNWMKANPIPPQYSRWGRFNELADHNLEVLRQILEDSAKNQSRSAIDQKIGALYSSCMDEAAVEKTGYTPIKPGLERIQSLKDKAALAPEVARLHNEGIGVFFRFGAGPDADNSTVNLGNIAQGGLGLPDKSYYLQSKDEEMRTKYVAHVSRMLQLIGEAPADADRQAKAIMQLETALAKASLDRVAMRDPSNTHHKMATAQLQALTPDFNFKQYFADRGTPAFEKLNVAEPDFFKGLNTTLQSTSLDDLKSYMTWHYVSGNAALLSKAFVDENFNFYGRILTGAQELQPRWKRCTQLVDRSLGEALGQKYVEKAFGKQAKEKTQQLVAIIEKEMAADIDSLTWMSSATKEQAMAKLRGVTNKIGYPEKWRDYSSVTIKEGDLVGDEERAREFEIKRNLNKVGKAVDRAEFNMTPPTVNAYYNPLENNINFPAGILQPPFYTNTADMAANFGAIGAVIGHELTHGFDDQGRHYDADGNLRDWWTKEDDTEFKKRADCLVNEYSGFSPVEGANVNGRLTLGENGADNAGIRLAYMALLGGLENGSVGKEKLDGYTPQQRFFLGFAQIWCANERPESLRNLVRTDPHSPGQFRVIGTVQNQPEFAEAFGCSAGQPMVSAHGCRVW
ncbi:MAG: M13 family metallopeptidase [Acidobacteriaceae bacterium]|nr:M13 family metallopeptidase [Acidobacteriaceae bacterium]MBV9037341.1 M13 family metallopeptidase [Acidobacteriaceae bacterium]MBV9224808.1 M13 family metallopeptidase [Acidobacteriaceae bacterium]MBV9306369.1 M13 family metallopeptidase [Acidobacteriaceae bacterium]MBV9678678.1 M13 family metallopeptidase [Acidobacteriaceae bacterium]